MSAAENELAALKKAARANAFAARRIAHEASTDAAAGVLSEVLAGYRGACVAGYWPINTEIDPRPAMSEAVAHGKVCLPVIEAAGKPLTFRKWVPDAPMIEGSYKEMVPEKGDRLIPEVVIVPLVAFDAAGGRLGYGGGFYDRTLELLRAARPVLAIGFAYTAQQQNALPLEPTDQPLNLIVTEQGVITP
jgi:5-formyltetrahydrofolate cyclo-ligase